ncbi:uncharacterized protein [Anoplolepis gracilipes]|uniref:uncharacterized protein n=1 Tax=Anoplolepis gracilipes TaxID=354296 RepID=UPI003B9F572E
MFFLVLLDAHCSGRTLATILIAWVTTAMVASILLQWEYMWIVLVILMLLFLLICGYTVCNVKRTHARILIEQQRRAAIRTVSGIMAANRREMESSTYSTHHTDLPPSYASVITTQTTTSFRASGEDKYKDPPPYSIVIASLNNRQDRNAEISSESKMLPFKFTTSNAADVAATTSTSTSVTCPHER